MIRKVPLFAGLKDKDLKTIAKSGKEFSYHPPTTIVKADEGGAGFFLILDGKVRVQRRGKTIATLGSGDFFGEMSLLDKQPRSADVVVAEDTTCFGLTPWVFISLIRSNPDIAIGMLKEIVGRLRATDKALTE